MAKQTQTCSLQLRLPINLKAALKRWAQINSRSLNGEIVFRLTSGADKEGSLQKSVDS